MPLNPQSRRGPRSAIAAGALLLVLVGCASVDVTTTAQPSSPSPTPTPTPTAPAEPSLALPRLPLTCGDLYSEAEATGFVGNPVTLKLDEAAVRNGSEAAALQDGLLSCTWGGEFKTDNSWDDHLVIRVLPDAAQAFDVGVWQVDDGAVVYPAGSVTSEYRCADYGDVYQCFVNVLVDGYWGQADVQGPVGEAAGAEISPALEARLRDLVDSLTLAVASAGEPNPRWITPSGALTGAICPETTQDPGLVSFPDRVATDRAGLRSCSVSSLDVDILPGGAWAYPVLQARADRPWYFGSPVAPIEVEGVGPALLSPGRDGCLVIVAVGGSLISVWDWAHEDDPGPLVAALPDVIAQITVAG